MYSCVRMHAHLHMRATRSYRRKREKREKNKLMQRSFFHFSKNVSNTTDLKKKNQREIYWIVRHVSANAEYWTWMCVCVCESVAEWVIAIIHFRMHVQCTDDGGLMVLHCAALCTEIMRIALTICLFVCSSSSFVQISIYYDYYWKTSVSHIYEMNQGNEYEYRNRKLPPPPPPFFFFLKSLCS